MKILHFGAGKIGRGLVFPFFSEQHEVTLSDRNPDLVQEIRKNNGYRVIQHDHGSTIIQDVVAPRIMTFPELEGMCDFDMITTAVLVSNLKEIAPLIVKVAKSNKRPLYIVPMENAAEATGILKREFMKTAQSTDGIYFLRSVIDRIVPAVSNGLDIECEKYHSILIEQCEGLGALCERDELLTEHIEREFDKKFLLVNGVHASAAYLGHPHGHQHICDVLADEVIRLKLNRIGNCYIQYLQRVYAFSKNELTAFFSNSLKRFSNPLIKDPLDRVGRNLLIKLGPYDRILRPLLFNKRHGLDYSPLEEVVEAASHFTIANDYEQYLSYLNAELEPGAVVNG